MTHRELNPEELLAALDLPAGKQAPAVPESDDPLLQLGRALREAAPPAEEPHPFFASRLKARLATTPMSQPKIPVAALILPLVGVLAAAGILFFLPGVTSRIPTTPEGRPIAARNMGGELTLVVGEVRWSREGGPWQSAEEGLSVTAGVDIEIPGDGRAVITLDDGSAVRLNGKTSIFLAQLDRDHVRIHEDHGTAYFRVMKDPNRAFTVETEEGTVTALGTAFAVARDADKKTLDVHCLESKVKVALAKDGTKLEKEVGQGKTLSYDAKKAPDAGTNIGDIDPQKIAVVPFFAWNISEDAKEGAPLGIATEVRELAQASDSGDAEKVAALTLKEEPATATVTVEPKPAPAPAPKPAPTGIVLSGSVSETTAAFSWKVNGVDVSHGFKLIAGPTSNPVYPGDKYQYLSDPGLRSYPWKGLPAGMILHFRICAYDGNGACGVYSNDIELKTGIATVKPLSGYKLLTGEQYLTVNATANGAQLSWTPCSAENFLYYKVVRSETNADPYYPNDGYVTAISGQQSTGFTDSSAVSGKSYYYRICSKESDGSVWCGNVVNVAIP